MIAGANGAEVPAADESSGGAMSLAGEEQLAAVREQILRRWSSYRWFCALGFAWAALYLLLPLLMFIYQQKPWPLWLLPLCCTWFSTWLAGVFVLGAALDRHLRRAREEI